MELFSIALCEGCIKDGKHFSVFLLSLSEKLGCQVNKMGCHMPNCRQALTQLFKVLQMFSTIKLNGNVEKMIF